MRQTRKFLIFMAIPKVFFDMLKCGRFFVCASLAAACGVTVLAQSVVKRDEGTGTEQFGPRKTKPQTGRTSSGWGLKNWQKGSDGRLRAPTRRNAPSAPDETVPWPNLTPEQVLIRVNNTDTITYGAVLRHAKLAIADLNVPAGMTLKEFDEAHDGAVYRALLKFSGNFIVKSLFAQEARKKGIKLTPQEVSAKNEETLAELRSSRKNPADSIKEFLMPGSYFQIDLTNTLLLARYRKDVIRGEIVVSKEDITKKIAEGEANRKKIEKENEALRLKLEGTLTRIKQGEDFGALAREVSACASSEDKGVFGTVKRADVLPELADVLWTMKEGEVYDRLVETPYSWHILKLNKKNMGFPDADGKPAPVVAVNFSHIVLEKKVLPKTITAEAAQNSILDEREEEQVQVMSEALLSAAKIETPLPLFNKRQGER